MYANPESVKLKRRIADDTVLFANYTVLIVGRLAAGFAPDCQGNGVWRRTKTG